MALMYENLIPGIWLCWMIYWWVSSRNVKATVQQESALSRFLHIGPLAIAVLLLWAKHIPLPFLNARFLPATAWPFWVGAVVTAVGLLFAVWARRNLGRNWSAAVTLKRGHELIVSGPYAWVRHPIYTGILCGFMGSAIARGEVRGIVAVVIAVAAIWRKLRLEERWMQQEFGDAYRAYSKRVAALVPFLL